MSLFNYFFAVEYCVCVCSHHWLIPHQSGGVDNDKQITLSSLHAFLARIGLAGIRRPTEKT